MVGINVLSLFDGMSCGRLALDRAGIPVNKYLASEIDKHASLVASTAYITTDQVGDVTKINTELLPKIDLLIGGSPCQGFSNLGEGLNFDDDRSKLFFEFIRIMADTLPRYFFLENVKMKKEYQEVISDYLGCKPIEVNSNSVSAQNRKRLYWTNIPFDGIQDRGITLDDIVEDPMADGRSTMVKTFYMPEVASNGKKIIYDHDRLPPYGFYEARNQKGKEARARAWRETGGDFTPWGKDYKEYKPRPDNKANCLVTRTSPADCIVDRDWNYRPLTLLEQERLQTLPDGYTDTVSDTQRRRMIGNGWTVDVIVEFFKNINHKTE